MSIRTRLVALVAAATLPLAGLGIVDSLRARTRLYDVAHATVLEEARLNAARLNAIIDGTRQMNRALVRYYLDSGRPTEACSAFARSLKASAPIYLNIALVELSGRVVCGALPWPPDLNVSDRAYFQNALQAKGPAMGNVIASRLTGRYAIDVSDVIWDLDGELAGVVTHAIDLDVLARTLAEGFDDRRKVMALLDRDRQIAVRLPRRPDDIGRRSGIAALDKLLARGPTFEYRGRDGREYIIAAAPVGAQSSGWTMLVGVDRDLALEAGNLAMVQTLILVAAAFAFSVGGAWWVGTVLIRRPIQRTVAAAQRMGAGDLSAGFPYAKSSTELGQLATALNQMAAAIASLLQQKTMLIREMQHRVMNSLQLLSSMLRLQQAGEDDPRIQAALVDAQNRVLAIGNIYRDLHLSEATGTVDFKAFLQGIAGELEKAFLGDTGGRVTVSAEAASVSTATACSLGIIVNELVTNALKHAAAPGQPTDIAVSFHHRDDGLVLGVEDDGPGLPPGFSLEKVRSLGLRVVQALTAQLGGKLRIGRRATGASFEIVLPASLKVA
ncbi:MAG: HAMP domain-containing protein [Alphaproteobacteria bacterium]|nr:HAMP domain-containing protein [Alphaproteobacteria bacterium]